MESLYPIIIGLVLVLVVTKMVVYRFIRIKVDESCIIEMVRKRGGTANFEAIAAHLELSEQRIIKVSKRSGDLVLDTDNRSISLK